VKLGHHANAWGGVVGDPVGVTSVKDLFYLTPDDTLATLAEVAAAGYAGVELFDGNLAEFAPDPAPLRASLDEHGLSLIGANFVFGEILDEELWRIRWACGWAAELGAEHVVVGGGAQRTEPPTEDDYDRLATGLDEVARIAEGHGLVAGFHPHMSTIAESPEQIERVFARSQIHLCPDTGHLQLGGRDPVELVRADRDRIAYVHIKDLDESGGFVPLGQGVLDAAGVIGALRDDDFQGWLTVETDGWEGDPSAGARTSRAHLETLLGGE
jgi:inosose dehydratase